MFFWLRTVTRAAFIAAVMGALVLAVSAVPYPPFLLAHGVHGVEQAVALGFAAVIAVAAFVLALDED